MLIRPRLEIPAVLRRALAAYRAGDPVDVAEAFVPDARMLTQIDRKLAARLAIPPGEELLQANSAMEIMAQYAAELDTYAVTHLDVISSLQAGRDIAAVCEWSIRLRGTEKELIGQCHNIWTLDRHGRKITSARSVCKILTPSYDDKLN